MSRRSDAPFSLEVSASAREDLEQMKLTSPAVRPLILTFLQELKNDQSQLEKLLDHKYGEGPGERETHTFGVSFVGEFARHSPRRDVWRVKIWDLDNRGVRYRIVYMYLPSRRLFIVLAIAPRRWDYKYDHPLSQRILCDYDRFLAKYG